MAVTTQICSSLLNVEAAANKFYGCSAIRNCPFNFEDLSCYPCNFNEIAMSMSPGFCISHVTYQLCKFRLLITFDFGKRAIKVL